jgi:hypothetical protein
MSHNPENKDCPRNHPEIGREERKWQDEWRRWHYPLPVCTCPPPAVDRVEEVRKALERESTYSESDMCAPYILNRALFLLSALDKANAEIAELRAELEAVKVENARLREVLKRIANTDYRGNRSSESQIAFDALKG